MGKFENGTLADQIVIDNQLSEYTREYFSQNVPFNSALGHYIQSYSISKNKINEKHYSNINIIPEAGEDSRNLEDDFNSYRNKKTNFPPYRIDRSVNQYKKYSLVIQNWVGHITKITNSFFYAELNDLVNPGTIEIGKFEKSTISHDDKPLIKIGATFYWNISIKSAGPRGQVSKESIIRFQRLTEWTESDFNDAIDRSTALLNGLNIINNDTSTT